MKLCRRFALFILIAVILAGCAIIRGTSPSGLEAPIERAAVQFSTDLQAGGYRIVTTTELKQWLDEGRELIIISTIPAFEERSYGTLPGSTGAAMPKTEQELTPEDREHLLVAAGSNKQQLLVVYCGFVASRRSHLGAKMLVDNGYKNVYRYPAGIAGWSEAGYKLLKF